MIAIAGGTVLLLGAAMIILPGPAILVIPAGLAILGLEFHWAKRWLEKVKEYGARAQPAVTQRTVPVPARKEAARDEWVRGALKSEQER